MNTFNRTFSHNVHSFDSEPSALDLSSLEAETEYAGLPEDHEVPTDHYVPDPASVSMGEYVETEVRLARGRMHQAFSYPTPSVVNALFWLRHAVALQPEARPFLLEDAADAAVKARERMGCGDFEALYQEGVWPKANGAEIEGLEPEWRDFFQAVAGRLEAEANGDTFEAFLTREGLFVEPEEAEFEEVLLSEVLTHEEARAVFERDQLGA